MAQLTRSDRATYCPYKGDAAYFSIPVGGERSIDAVWSYETPYAVVAGIKDHIVPWDAAWRITQLVGGNTHFVLASSGHIAGMINPPSANKYGWSSI